VHALFEGTLSGGAEPKSDRPLAWASLPEVYRGKVDRRPEVEQSGLAMPGEISWTAIEVLTMLER
jgi:hypothetical protein